MWACYERLHHNTSIQPYFIKKINFFYFFIETWGNILIENEYGRGGMLSSQLHVLLRLEGPIGGVDSGIHMDHKKKVGVGAGKT